MDEPPRASTSPSISAHLLLISSAISWLVRFISSSSSTYIITAVGVSSSANDIPYELPFESSAPASRTSSISSTLSITSSAAAMVSSSSVPSGICILTCICGELISGTNANPFTTTAATLKTSRSNAHISTSTLCFNDHFKTPVYLLRKPLKPAFSSGTGPASRFADIAGTSVIATIRLANSEYPIVRAISENRSLVIPSVNIIGTNTHTVVIVEAVIAPPTCLAPAMAAFAGGTPSRRSLKVFSITTIELSTSIPTATARPESDIILSDIPEKYIRTIANMILTGIENTVISVDFMCLKNSNSIRTANTAPSSRLCIIDLMIRLMYSP